MHTATFADHSLKEPWPTAPNAVPWPHARAQNPHQQRAPLLSNDLKDDLVALLPRLQRFARALTRSAQEADDLVQEACLRALDRAAQWDSTQPLDRWVFAIIRNTWISERRKAKVRLGQGHVPAEESGELVSRDTGEGHHAAAELNATLSALPEEFRTVLLIVSVEGYSYQEASTLLDVPLGTVMSRMHRARKALAGALAEPKGGNDEV